MREMVRPTSAADINSRSLSEVPTKSLTSFSASLDGSLKDVELRGSLAGRPVTMRARHEREESAGDRHRYRGLNDRGIADGFRRPLPGRVPCPGGTTDHHTAMGYQGAQGECHRLAGGRTDPRRRPRYRLRAG